MSEDSSPESSDGVTDRSFNNKRDLIVTIRAKTGYFVNKHRKILFSVRNVLVATVIVLTIFWILYELRMLVFWSTDVRYLVSALMQCEASILAIVISLTALGVQLAAQRYSHRVVDIFIHDEYFHCILFLYLGAIFIGILSLYILPDNLSIYKDIVFTSNTTILFISKSLCHNFLYLSIMFIIFSLYLGFTAIAFNYLRQYIGHILTIIKPEKIVEKIVSSINPDKIIKFAINEFAKESPKEIKNTRENAQENRNIINKIQNNPLSPFYELCASIAKTPSKEGSEACKEGITKLFYNTYERLTSNVNKEIKKIKNNHSDQELVKEFKSVIENYLRFYRDIISLFVEIITDLVFYCVKYGNYSSAKLYFEALEKIFCEKTKEFYSLLLSSFDDIEYEYSEDVEANVYEGVKVTKVKIYIKPEIPSYFYNTFYNVLSKLLFLDKLLSEEAKKQLYPVQLPSALLQLLLYQHILYEKIFNVMIELSTKFRRVVPLDYVMDLIEPYIKSLKLYPVILRVPHSYYREYYSPKLRTIMRVLRSYLLSTITILDSIVINNICGKFLTMFDDIKKVIIEKKLDQHTMALFIKYTLEIYYALDVKHSDIASEYHEILRHSFEEGKKMYCSLDNDNDMGKITCYRYLEKILDELYSFTLENVTNMRKNEYSNMFLNTIINLLHYVIDKLISIKTDISNSKSLMLYFPIHRPLVKTFELIVWYSICLLARGQISMAEEFAKKLVRLFVSEEKMILLFCLKEIYIKRIIFSIFHLHEEQQIALNEKEYKYYLKFRRMVFDLMKEMDKLN